MAKEITEIKGLPVLYTVELQTPWARETKEDGSFVMVSDFTHEGLRGREVHTIRISAGASEARAAGIAEIHFYTMLRKEFSSYEVYMNPLESSVVFLITRRPCPCRNDLSALLETWRNRCR